MDWIAKKNHKRSYTKEEESMINQWLKKNKIKIIPNSEVFTNAQIKKKR